MRKVTLCLLHISNSMKFHSREFPFQKLLNEYAQNQTLSALIVIVHPSLSLFQTWIWLWFQVFARKFLCFLLCKFCELRLILMKLLWVVMNFWTSLFVTKILFSEAPLGSIRFPTIWEPGESEVKRFTLELSNVF